MHFNIIFPPYLGFPCNLLPSDLVTDILYRFFTSHYMHKIKFKLLYFLFQVTFHVATLMPTKETDPSCNGKKLHIGNDEVIIVYNESGEEYNIQTVRVGETCIHIPVFME